MHMLRALRVLAMIIGMVTAGRSEAQGAIIVAPPSEGLSLLSPPTLGGASNCSGTDWRLALSGGIPGGEYEVYDWVPGFGPLNQLGIFRVDPNGMGVTIVTSRWPQAPQRSWRARSRAYSRVDSRYR